MDLKKFNNKRIDEVAKHREDLSYYNHNYYEDDDGNLIYCWSDDDNYTEYGLVIDGQDYVWFAESFCNKGDIMLVFRENYTPQNN